MVFPWLSERRQELSKPGMFPGSTTENPTWEIIISGREEFEAVKNLGSWRRDVRMDFPSMGVVQNRDTKGLVNIYKKLWKITICHILMAESTIFMVIFKFANC